MNWNVETLKEYVDTRLEAQDKAVIKSEESIHERFESVNKFRENLRDQQATFLPRQEYDRAHTDLVHTVESNTKSLTESILLMRKLNSRFL